MLTIRPIRWALVLAPFLLLVAGCSSNNEARVDTKGTTTSPDATKSTEEALKQGAVATKKVTPASYPGANRRQ